MACDYAINPLLLDAGLTLPKDVLIEHRFRGMSAERIYNLIDEQQDQDGSNGEGENSDGAAPGGEWEKQADNRSTDGGPTAPATPGCFGQVLDAPEPEGDDGHTVAEQAREWRIAVEQAENIAKLAGKLPAGITIAATRGMLQCRMHDFMSQDVGKFCRVQRMDKCRIVKQGNAIHGHGLNRVRGQSTQTKE
jgi:Putative metallopeptidase domain